VAERLIAEGKVTLPTLTQEPFAVVRT
jgi:hypothetical protein